MIKTSSPAHEMRPPLVVLLLRIYHQSSIIIIFIIFIIIIIIITPSLPSPHHSHHPHNPTNPTYSLPKNLHPPPLHPRIKPLHNLHLLPHHSRPLQNPTNRQSLRRQNQFSHRQISRYTLSRSQTKRDPIARHFFFCWRRRKPALRIEVLRIRENYGVGMESPGLQGDLGAGGEEVCFGCG